MAVNTEDRTATRQRPTPAAMLALVREITSCVDSRRALDELLDCAVGEIARTADFAAGHAYRVVDGAMLTSSKLWWQRDEGGVIPLSAASRSGTFVAGEGIPGRALATGEPAWSTAFDSDDDLPRQQAAEASGIRAALAFPVLIGERVVALIELFDTEPREPSSELLDAIAIIGTTIGRAFERLEVAERRRDTTALEQTVLNNAGDAFVSIDADGLVTGWNREAERMFGYGADEAIGATMTDLIMPPDYRADHDAGVKNYMATGHGRVPDRYVELEALRKSGERFPIEMAVWGMRINGQWNFYSFTRDITERKQRESELEYRAVHDDVTGLPNRAAAVEHIAAALELAEEQAARPALLFFDLDRFSVLRERLGHHATNELLRIVGERISDVAGDTGWVARVGGDEFVLVCDGALGSGYDGAAALAERVVASLGRPLELDEDQVSIGASTAVMLADAQADSAEDLLRDAGAGLSESRLLRRGEVQIFDDDVRARIRQRISLERDLATGIDEGQLRLYYQPLVNFRSQRLIGFEALVRWQHPTLGLLAPGAFIEMAEESGLIVPLGTWVLHEACRQAREWQDAGFTDLTIAVNISARQFAQTDLIDTITTAVERYGVDTEAVGLTLEVTETLVMNDPDAAAQTLRRLHDRGFALAIDDFGTGYSSLAYLKSFPVDTVKIDRSFVMNVDTDPHNRAIVSAVTQLGHALELNVLAEGIETEAECACLSAMGCDLAQGYLFDRPAPAATIAHTHEVFAGR